MPGDQSERNGPTIQRMLFVAKLRRLRTDAGLSREEAGEAIWASVWKIHRGPTRSQVAGEIAQQLVAAGEQRVARGQVGDWLVRGSASAPRR